MRIIVDTCVWSMALRRGTPAAAPEVSELRQLIDEGRVQMLGPIRQEILSGIRLKSQFEELRDRLRGFPDLSLVPEDYELAAEHFSSFRAKGIQGSNTDCLICAVSVRRNLAILTTDKDFALYHTIVALRLHTPRDEV